MYFLIPKYVHFQLETLSNTQLQLSLNEIFVSESIVNFKRLSLLPKCVIFSLFFLLKAH